MSFRSYKNSTVILLIILLGSCSRPGLVKHQFQPEIYQVKSLTTGTQFDYNPKFIVYGDNRTGYRLKEHFLREKNWKTWKQALFPFYQIYMLASGTIGIYNYKTKKPGYGIHEQKLIRDAIYQAAKQSKVNFILNSGDMPTNGNYPDHWKQFLDLNKNEHPMFLEIPFIPVLGNHEHGNNINYGQQNYRDIFNFPANFVLDYKDAAIIVMDSDLIIDQYQDIDDETQDKLFRQWFVGTKSQPSWLEKQLYSRRQAFKIIVLHHPPISFGKHFDDWKNPEFGSNLLQKRKELLSLLGRFGVQLVITGHEHYYEHNIYHFNQNQIHILVSGGGGVPLRDLKSNSTVQAFENELAGMGINGKLVKREKIYHYCLIDIQKNLIGINVMEVSKDKNVHQRLADQFEIKLKQPTN